MNKQPTTKEEIVWMVMENHDCQSSKSFSMDAKRLFNYDISASSVSAVLRKFINAGLVGSSKNDRGITVYWIITNKAIKVNKYEI